VTNDSGIGRSARSLIVTLYRFAVYFLLSPAVLTIASNVLMPADSYGAIIDRFSCHRFDHVAEVQFQMRGTAPRWHLHTHGQELWLDLENARFNMLLGAASVPVVFPLTRIGLRDLGGGEVRLVFRVRGQVDYVVAQLPHVLIVRIAPSGEAGDLAQSLLLRAERTRSEYPSLVAPMASAVNQTQNGTAASIKNDRAIPVEGAQTAHKPAAAGSAIPNASEPPPILFAGPVTGMSGQTHAATTLMQPVQPVFQRVGSTPAITQDKTRPIVAIDAGHGGFDPGTESAGGIPEKALTLAIAQRLANALESRGIAAELTRDDDRYLPLSERTELANHVHADLFISVHLNSSPDWNTSGLETYYLNNTSDRATIRLARIENGGGYGAVGQSNLNYILANLRQDYKAHESSSLAWLIETRVATSVDTALGIRVNTLGAKMGPFYVLVGAEMPAVLVECGFLSNPREAQLLVQPAYQDALAQGIAVAIMQYFDAGAAIGNL
jgi:N-acetylmuramoyl-L-alanine amidase